MDETRMLLRPSEAARRLGRTARWVIRMAQRGEIPAVHMGRRWLVVWPDALDVLLAKWGTGS